MSYIIGYSFIFIGLGLNLIGCFGLMRLPDVYSRLSAVTKCVTTGTCSILIGTIIIKGFAGAGPTGGGIKAFLCLVFLLLTAPVSAHAISKGAHGFGVKLWEKSVCDKYREDKEK
jgi:multicomponent Na+:H+ antiporter subunit G